MVSHGVQDNLMMMTVVMLTVMIKEEGLKDTQAFMRRMLHIFGESLCEDISYEFLFPRFKITLPSFKMCSLHIDIVKIIIIIIIIIIIAWDFPGSPVAKTLCSQCRGPGFHLWSGT